MDKKGGILVSVLLLVGILALLAVPVLQMTASGYKASVDEQIRTQSFYLAEAGLAHGKTAALAQLTEWATSNPEKLIDSDPDTNPFLVVAPTTDLATGTYTAKAGLTHLHDNEYELSIRSVGTAHAKNRLAKAASLTLPVTIIKGAVGELGAIFANGSIELKDNAEIHGDVVSTATVKFKDKAKIFGNITEFEQSEKFPPDRNASAAYWVAWRRRP